MQNLVGNLRYALRQFRMSPVFTAAAILTLALGIGGTTAIFTLMHALPGWRRRRLLCGRGTAGPLGHGFLPAVRTA
jgi:hypothetical protein